jgi:hypothetical protein
VAAAKATTSLTFDTSVNMPILLVSMIKPLIPPASRSLYQAKLNTPIERYWNCPRRNTTYSGGTPPSLNQPIAKSLGYGLGFGMNL